MERRLTEKRGNGTGGSFEAISGKEGKKWKTSKVATIFMEPEIPPAWTETKKGRFARSVVRRGEWRRVEIKDGKEHRKAFLKRLLRRVGLHRKGERW